MAKRLGDDAVINTSKPDFQRKTAELTNNKGFGFVYETAGVDVTMKLAFELADNKSEVCFIGTPTKDVTFTPREFENMNRKEFKLTGSWMSYSAPYPGKEWSLTAHYFSTGQLKFDGSMILKKLPLNDIKSGFDMYKTLSKNRVVVLPYWRGLFIVK